jgi:hypothetical protein
MGWHTEMLSFLGPLAVLENITMLCQFAGETAGTETDLRTRYFTALCKTQDHPFRFTPRSGEIVLDFAIDDPQTSALLAHFAGSAARLAECSSAEAAAPAVAALVDEAMAVLQQYDLSTAAVVRLLIGCLLVAHHGGAYGGASMGETIGVVWLRPDPAWEPVDCAESILHESVHQALLLDERVNGMFDEALAGEMERERGLVTSAVWPYTSEFKARRPYDRAFHSACVGATLVDFYERLGRPQKARSLCEPMPLTLAELQAKDEFLNSHGRAILAEVDEMVRAASAALGLPAQPR